MSQTLLFKLTCAGLLCGVCLLAGALVCAEAANQVPASTSTKTDARAKAALAKFYAAVRAGEDAKVAAAITELSSLNLKQPQPVFELSEAADFLIGRKQWQLAKTFMGKMPQAQPGWGYVLVGHFAEESKSNPAQLAEIKELLRKGALQNRQYYCHLQLVLADKLKQTATFFNEFEAQLKLHADDIAGVKIYLNLLSSSSDKRSVSWMAKSFAPKLASKNYVVAESLKERYPSDALFYLRRARTIPFVDADKQIVRDYYSHMAIAVHFEGSEKKIFSQWVRGMMVDCLNRTGQKVEAQALLLQLSKEQGGNLPSYALTQQAGQIQSGTPTHPLEQQIIQHEPENKNSFEYWRGRADYYRGRKEDAKEREALLKALEVTRLDKGHAEDHYFARSIAASEYARFLEAHESDAQALAFLWTQFDDNNYLEFRRRILSDIEYMETDQTHYLMPTDDRLWTFLQNWQSWNINEEHLLWRMARNATAQQLETTWQRAEKVAGTDHKRQSMVGWVMNRCHNPRRALPLLVAACKSTDEDTRRSAYFTLFESYLDLKDWHSAEKIWPEASKQLGPTELPEWMARVSLAAAKSGSPQESLRIWKRKDEIDFAYLPPLTDLKEAGMTPLLVNYYREQQKLKPSSKIPAEALRLLAEP